MLHDFVIDVQGRLVGNVKDPAQFARVRQVGGADAAGRANVDLLDGEEGETFGAHVRLGELGEDGARQRPHDAQRREQRRHVGDVDAALARRLPPQ